jgi:transketolase
MGEMIPKYSKAIYEAEEYILYWEKIKDLIDQLIDLILNYRQSGHPGGSRSKVHALIALLLGGAMRWDIRHPEKRFSDRFILGAGHTIPLIYCTLAVFNEALRVKYKQTGDPRYYVPEPDLRALYWEDLLNFRRRGGLSGHAEMQGKTLFIKFNTGPSGHGSPAAAGIALALKRAGVGNVKVFIMEGETGLTPGGTHETLNSAWGLNLDNLYYLIDWNDYGIDDHRISDIVYGTPNDWFGSHGWRVFGTEQGNDWREVTKTIEQMVYPDNPKALPSAAWFKTRKGRGYLLYDNFSHGMTHKINSELFWETKREFAERYCVTFQNYGKAAPKDPAGIRIEFEANLKTVIEVLHRDQELIDYLSERLIKLGESVPENPENFQLGLRGNPFQDQRLYDFLNYPEDLFVAPGTVVANRAALAKWGSWVNSFGENEYGRPLFLACSADLAGSTNIIGFADKYHDFKGYGWYGRVGTSEGALLPQGITEFANAGIMAGVATVNLSNDAYTSYDGFWGITSTYGSFSYLIYGAMRLFSQLAQDCDFKVGKLIFVAAHSGPETADDSRTHFGVFEPGVTQLFPKGQVLNLHPWEYNEVPVLLGAALKQDIPIIVLHLTRPPIEIPDRQKLGIPSHFTAARGAYIVRDFKPGKQPQGTIIVQGTSAMTSIVKILPNLDKELNLKIIYATSSELFAKQSHEYRQTVLNPLDCIDSMVITTQARGLMHDWIFNNVAEEYALSADWDNRWRTGGTVEEVIDEAHLSPHWVLEGIRRFVMDRNARLERLIAK